MEGTTDRKDRAMKATRHITNTTVDVTTLTPGTWVEGESVGYTRTGRVAYRSTWAGHFEGIRDDQWDDEDHPTTYVFFTDGHINGHPDRHFGFPLDQLVVTDATN